MSMKEVKVSPLTKGQTVINLLVRLTKHFPDNIVAAGGDPEGPRLALVAEVVDHRPRIENLRLAEAVTVPLANFIELIGSAVVFRHMQDADIVQGQLKRLQERRVSLSQDLSFFFIQAVPPQHH